MASNSFAFGVSSESEVFNSIYFDGDGALGSSSDVVSSDELGIIILDVFSFFVVGVVDANIILFFFFCAVW